jgi:hypothetical protein
VGAAGLPHGCGMPGGHHIYHHAQPMGVMAGWAGSGPAVGRTPEAECQWWADRLGSRRAEWGSAGAPRLFYSSRGSVQRGDVLAMGCGEAVEKLSLEEEDSRTYIKEDCCVLAYRHVPPCGKGSTNPAGSGAPGLRTGPIPLRCRPRKAPPAEAGGEGSGGRRRRMLGGGGLGPVRPPTSPPPPLAWGIYSPSPAASGGGGGGSGGSHRGWWAAGRQEGGAERAEGGSGRQEGVV